jgi:tagatose-6-phosphate ketose/aldose isomerase
MNNKFYTLKEIKQQPKLWNNIWELIRKNKQLLTNFLHPFNDCDVIFTGAGSSFFIGEIVAPVFQKDTNLTTKAISTTEIVTHPLQYINPNKHTLLISFARSGDSPESLAAIKLANQVSQNIKSLVITCNSNGALAKIANDKKNYSIVLPEEANDKSLAMTSSVTAMAIAAQLLGRLDKLEEEKEKIEIAANTIETFFTNYDQSLRDIAKTTYDRAVFLGSGAMIGVARESHLKLQELTDGEIISKFDSFLGFRHGPKAVVNKNTLIVYFFANDPYVRQYEFDLVKSIKKGQNPKLSVGIYNNDLPNDVKNSFDIAYPINLEGKEIDEGYLSISSLVVAQLLATYKSLNLEYNPDSPSKSGAIHRVVQGVTIYNHI